MNNKIILTAIVLLCAAISLCGCYPSSAAGKASQKDLDLMTSENKKEIEITSNGCRIERFTIPSVSMGRNIRVAVVLPPTYEEKIDVNLPILYTLHGMSAPYDTFAKMSKLHDALSDKPFIYTCFDCDEAGWYIDSTLKPESQFETFFFKEFIPYIDGSYRINGKRGLVGFSMGGFGSMYFALQAPEMFTSVCTLSAGFHRYSKGHDGLNERLEPLIGTFENNKPLYEKMDTFKTLQKHVANQTRLPKMNLRCGTEDFLLMHNRDFLDTLIKQNAVIRERVAASVDEADKRKKSKMVEKLMVDQGIDFTYTEAPGGHTWEYWHAQAPEFAKFFYDSVK